jgi:ABC-2 type transport system permease protein
MKTLRKLIITEWKLFIREPVNLVFTLILPAMILITMGEVFGRSQDSSDFYRGVNAMDYYLPAYIGIVMAAIGLVSIPVHIAGYRERGILRRLRSSSLSMKSLIVSQLVVSVIITLLCVIVLIVLAVVIYRIQMPHSLGLVIAGSAIAMLSFVALGLFLGLVLPNSRTAQGVGMPLWFFMFMLSGSGPPRDVMTSVMQNAGRLTPTWHSTSLIQDAWLGYGWNTPASLALLGFLVVCAVISYMIFRRE